jgi:hypothetical protein
VSNHDVTRGLCLSCNGAIAASNQTACVSCPPGETSPDGLQCKLCPVGYPWQRSACSSPCVPGTACYAVNDSGVIFCPACVPCLPGSFSDAPAATTCNRCPPGSAQPSSGGQECRPCAAGYYQPNEGQPACLMCPVGYFCPDATSWVRCPANSACPPGSSAPQFCASLYTATASGCVPSPTLIGIIVASVVGATILLAVLTIRRYRHFTEYVVCCCLLYTSRRLSNHHLVSRRDEERISLLARSHRANPVYGGL